MRLLWLTYLTSIMFSRFIRVVACVRVSFLLRLHKIRLYGYATFCPSIHLYVDGHMGCSHLLAIVKRTAMDTGMQVSVPVPAFNSFENILRKRTTISYGNCVFNFIGFLSCVFFFSLYLKSGSSTWRRYQFSPQQCHLKTILMIISNNLRKWMLGFILNSGPSCFGLL